MRVLVKMIFKPDYYGIVLSVKQHKVNSVTLTLS